MQTFISYSQKDEAAYTSLCLALEGQKIEYWDPKVMRVGASLRHQLREAINKCDICVFLATRNSVVSRWCSAEIGAFWGAGRNVVVFLADPDLTNDQLPPQFQGDLSTRDVRDVIRTIKTETEISRLPNPEDSPGPLVFFSQDDRDKEKREVIRRSVTQASDTECKNPQKSFLELQALADLDDDNISLRKGLFIGMPFKQKFSESLIARIVNWVRAGGNLVVTGFELGERHHQTNVSQLTYNFGISFNSDTVVEPKFPGTQYGKGYNATLLYENIKAPDHSLFQDVKKMALKNTCSLHLEPGALPLLLADPNQIRELKTEAAEYSGAPEYVLAAGEQTFKEPYIDPNRAVVALAPQGLTGKGRVLALGTWDFRSDGHENDNSRFIGNLWHWLAN